MFDLIPNSQTVQSAFEIKFTFVFFSPVLSTIVIGGSKGVPGTCSPLLDQFFSMQFSVDPPLLVFPNKIWN